MSLFEYVAVAFSLIFSFSVMRLVGGIPHALDPARLYWVHAVHVGFQLLATAVSFWMMWNFRNVDWTLGGFLLVLAGPALYYMNATLLVPEAPASIQSWREHYFAIRRRYWGVICIYAIVLGITTTHLLEMPLMHAARAVQIAILASGITGIISAKPQVHAMLALVFFLLPLSALLFASVPGFSAQ